MLYANNELERQSAAKVANTLIREMRAMLEKNP
jgi:hypothetical protein